MLTIPQEQCHHLNHNSRNTNRCFKIPVTRSAEKICCLLWYHAILYCMTSVFENAFYDGQLNINKRALLFGRLRGIWFEAHVAQGWQNNTTVIFKLNYSSYRPDHRLRSCAAGNEMLITSAYEKLEKYFHVQWIIQWRPECQVIYVIACCGSFLWHEGKCLFTCLLRCETKR